MGQEWTADVCSRPNTEETATKAESLSSKHTAGSNGTAKPIEQIGKPPD